MIGKALTASAVAITVLIVGVVGYLADLWSGAVALGCLAFAVIVSVGWIVGMLAEGVRSEWRR